MAAEVQFLGYIRVSTTEQAVDWKTSLRDQVQAIKARASVLGGSLLDAFIWEDRFSGERAEDRTGFMDLVEFCRTHPRPRSRPGVVLFLNDSRFGRFEDPDEAGYWRFQLAGMGWQVRFAENDDTDDVTTRHVLRSIGGAQASEYLATLRRNVQRGKRGGFSQGLWQTRAPFGYRRLAQAPGREAVVLEAGERKASDQTVRLTPGPDEEVATVVWAFETYASGMLSLGKLAEELRARAPRLSWSKPGAAKMLANRAYLGDVLGHRRSGKSEGFALRPESEWIRCAGAHPALVSEALFEAVQARLAQNRRATRAVAGGYPLSGLIRCAQCGSAYTGGGGPFNHRDPADPDRYCFYKCKGSTERDVECPGDTGTLTKRIIEPLVIGAVAAEVAHPRVQALIRAEAARVVAELSRGAPALRASLENQRREAETRRENLARAIAAGVLTEEEARREMGLIRKELSRTEQEIRALESREEATRATEQEAERLARLAADFPAQARAVGGRALRELLRPWIEDAVFDKETRELVLTIRQVPALPHAGGDQGTAPVYHREVLVVPGGWSRTRRRRAAERKSGS